MCDCSDAGIAQARTSTDAQPLLDAARAAQVAFPDNLPDPPTLGGPGWTAHTLR